MSTVRWASLRVFVNELADRGDAGVVDQCVERPDASFGLGEELVETNRVAHVERQAQRPLTQLGGDHGDRTAVDVADDHGHARAQAGLGGGAADAAGAPVMATRWIDMASPSSMTFLDHDPSSAALTS